MKQLLFLLLFPCLALAQYPANGNQKITLGEQTTADGLVYRGIRADTASKIVPFSDTSAYIILDTVEKTLWLYKAGQVPKWQQVGGSAGGGGVTSFSAGTTGLTPSTATTGAVTLGGTLAVANGGTNASTFTAGSVVFAGASGTYTQDNTNLFFDNTNNRLSIGTTSPGDILPPSWTSSSTDRLLQIETGGAGGSSGLLLRRGDEITGLDVWNDGQINAFSYIDDRWDNATSALNFRMRTKGTPVNAMTIKGSGNVGIGTTTPQSGYRLHVVDSVYVGGNVSASAYTTRSDYDLKDEIQNISYGINEVMQMQPVKYTYKSNGSTQLGFIAQDIGVITPEVVSFEDKMSVYYNALIPILTKAIQEQQALIKSLEQRILILENK